MGDIDSSADVSLIISDVDRRWMGVSDWVIFDDEDGLGIVRSEDGCIIAETKISGGTHQDAVRIVRARADISRLLIVARGQCEKINSIEAENAELRLDVDENVAHGKAQGERIRALEKELGEIKDRCAKLEDACRNVLSTEPPPLQEVESAWNTCVHMSEYQSWFHRSFNLDQVGKLLECATENGDKGQVGSMSVMSYQSSLLVANDPKGNQVVQCLLHNDNGPLPHHTRPPATRRVVIELLVDDVSDRRLRDFIHRICTK